MGAVWEENSAHKGVEKNHRRPVESLKEADMMIENAKTTAQKAAAVLTMATQAEMNGEKKEVIIAGQKIKYPARAAETFQAALNLVVRFFGDNKISLNELSFKKFAGNIVGESTKEGIEIDPIMLLHPAARFAHVIGHELAHNKGEIQNELLVESYVRAVLGNTGVEPPEAYKKAVNGFVKFALGFNKNGNAVENTKAIYQLYYVGKYEEIYKKYTQGMSPAEEDEALKLFQEVFPELRYTGTGKYSTKPLVDDTISELRRIGKKAVEEEAAA